MSHVSLVTLGVDDLGLATSFYEALGWRRSSASVDGTVTFFHGSPALGLFGRADLAAEAHVPTEPADSPPRTALATNLPDRAAVDRLVTTAEGLGAVVCKRPEVTDWGGYSGYFLDLDGHLWEVAHNPYFPLDADGRVTLPSD